MCQESKASEPNDNRIWRGCWPFQLDALRRNDPSQSETPTTEMTGNPHLGSVPSLRFTRDRAIAETFASRQGNALIEINLDNLSEDEWQRWGPTGDIHVSFEAVVREANLDDDEA